MRGEKLTERVTDLDEDRRAAYRVAGNVDDVSTRVIRGVEEIVGEDEDNRTWLYDSIDPDALDTIFSEKHSGATRESGKVVFTTRECKVVVHGNGEIYIYAPKDNEVDE